MKIISLGDSFFWGTDLADQNYPHVPSKSVYPCLIAKNFKFDYECFAIPGAGNFLIYTNLIKSIEANLEDCVYFINWSWIDRFDYADEKIHCGWNTVRPGLDNMHKDKFFYKNFHSELQDKLLSLTYIFAAVQILQQSNCKFIMTYMDRLLLDKTWHCPPEINLLQQKVQPFLQTFDGHTFLEWSRRHSFPESPSWHPLELAHKKAAEYWLPQVCDLLNTNSKEDYLHAFI